MQEIQSESNLLNYDHANLVSARGRRLFDEREIEETIFEEVSKDRWHGIHNPEGKIDCCNDYNNLCEELFRYAINKLWPSGVDMAALLRQSSTAGGRKSTKRAAMSCIRQFFCANSQDQPRHDDLILTPGSDAAYDMLSFVLFSPGDVILCPTPFTGRIYNDFEERAQVELRAIPWQDMLGIHLDTANFQQVLEEVTAKGQNVRAISLIQPHNPLGLAFDWDEIAKLCEWAIKKNLWILIDETFVSHISKRNKKGSAIKSFITLAEKSDDLRQKLIWIWSVDKDLCLPGLRFSVIHTQNDDVHRALSRLEIIQPCAPLVQSLVECLFGDLQFMSDFYEKRNHLITENREMAISRLQAMGVPFVKPMAGNSVFLCLRKFIQENSFEEEEIMWKRLMTEASIYFNPGMFMGTCDAGWMQMVISIDKRELQEALNRLEAVLKSIGEKDNLKDWEGSLSLSILPAENSRVPDRPSISFAASDFVLQTAADKKAEEGQQYESDVMRKLVEEAAISYNKSAVEYLPKAGKSPKIEEFESHSSLPPFPASQNTSLEIQRSNLNKDGSKKKEKAKVAWTNADELSVLHSQTPIDTMDEIQLNKSVISSPVIDYSVYGHQPVGEVIQLKDAKKDVLEASVPKKQDFDFITQLVKNSEQNIKATETKATSPGEQENTWKVEKYSHSAHTQQNSLADDAVLLSRIFCEDPTQKGGDELIHQVFSVFPASQWSEGEEEVVPLSDLKSKALISQRIYYASEQRALQRQASTAKKKLSSIDEVEDRLTEDSHHPPRVPSQLTDFSFIEQLVSGGGVAKSKDQYQCTILNSVFSENYLADYMTDYHIAPSDPSQADHLNDQPEEYLTNCPNDCITNHQTYQNGDNQAYHKNALEFDLVEEFEPIPMKTPSPKAQITIDLPLRISQKEEEIKLNTQFHQMENQSEAQSARIIEIIERIFLDTEVVAPPLVNQQEDPWSRSDSGLAADHSNASSTVDVDLGECPPLESSTLKRVAKTPNNQRLEDSGVFVGEKLPSILSIDFPLLLPMEKEQKGIEIKPIAQYQPLFSISELRDLVDVNPPPDELSGKKKSAFPSKFKADSAQEFNFDLENSRLKPATELSWQPIESLELEKQAFFASQKSFTLEKANEDDLSLDQMLHFDQSLPQQYSEAQLLAMLSEGSAFCPIQGEVSTSKPPPSPFSTHDLNVQKKSDTDSTNSSVQKWEPLESLYEPANGSLSNQLSNIYAANGPKNSDTQVKKFSEDLKAMEKCVEPAPKDPTMVIGEYNQKIQGKGLLPLGLVPHSPIPSEPGYSSEKMESMDIDLRFCRAIEEEWLTKVSWIVGAEEKEEATYGLASQKKKSSKSSWRKLSAAALERRETAVCRFKVSLSEEEDINKCARKESSPTGQHIEEEKNLRAESDKLPEEVTKIDVKEEENLSEPVSTKKSENDYRSSDYLVKQEHIYPSKNDENQENKLLETGLKPFNIDNQQASISKFSQSPERFRRKGEQSIELIPSITVQSTHPIYYSKPYWKHSKIARLNHKGKSPSKKAAPKFVRVCCPGRAATSQVHHKLHMNRSYRRGDLRADKNTIVIEHTNITEITYSGGRGKTLEDRDMSTSASICINSFAPNEFFDSIRFMHVDQDGETDVKEFSESREEGLEYDEVKKMAKGEDPKAEHSDVCCRMRVINKQLRKSVEEKENDITSRRKYDYLMCKNPEHATSIDHCDPARLYTLKRSTMPSASLEFGPIDSMVDPSKITVNAHRNGTENTDTVTLRHTPGSNWIVSSVCKTVQYCDQTSSRSHGKKFSVAHKETQV